MKYLNQEIENELKNQGAELIRFVGISHLNEKQNRQLPNAIVFALPLTAEYAKMVFNIPDYVQARIADNYNFDDDEYSQTEHKAGEIADELAKFITGKGYKAISQSDTGLVADGVFDYETKESVLPHKTVALLGGLGWIGKSNLLITPEYGAAQCLGTVLHWKRYCMNLYLQNAVIALLASISARERFLKVKFGVDLFQEMKSLTYMDVVPV